ncbi:carboxymuconolactone decarboxylase family protein [Desertivirga brevis]|uniref:carboxymuconolactone decarboxylase family protein n=1 Tax=Desertivirga brevis TaxID=2810310 RepID=UPI001A97BA2C|nr:carboxymuconolactone decarboxylase family protein [Pedobacter sp. SYSU D00873]
MINVRKTIKGLLLLLLTINLNSMNAQNNNNAYQPLTAQQQSLVSISALTSVGDLEHLKTALHTGLDAGLTVNQTKEILVQLYAYCGFPRSLNGINTLMKVVEERKARGKKDVVGKEATSISVSLNKYERGRKTLETLTKTAQLQPAPGFGEFAPRIDTFLKEHLFADIFDSDVFTYQQREFITISALAAMTGVEPQLQAHIGIGKNTGITENQLEEIAQLIENQINKTQANTIRKIIERPLTPVAEPDMLVRISEIEIVSEHLEEYISILKEEAGASVKIEPGVIAIFPMSQKENPTQIRIIEIYANKAAYQSHLQTPHFQLYKTTTQKMVKSLKLVDMERIDVNTMQEIFKKLK